LLPQNWATYSGTFWATQLIVEVPGDIPVTPPPEATLITAVTEEFQLAEEI